MVIDGSGYVGIGVSSPAMPLEIYKSGTGTSNIRLRADATTNDFGGGIYFTTDGNSTTNVAYIRQKEHSADKYGFDFAGYSGGLASRMVMTGDGHFRPAADGSQDLGAASYRWRNIFSADLQLSNVGTGGNEVDGTEGNWTIQEGDENLFIINRKTGKQFKIKMEEL